MSTVGRYLQYCGGILSVLERMFGIVEVYDQYCGGFSTEHPPKCCIDVPKDDYVLRDTISTVRMFGIVEIYDQYYRGFSTELHPKYCKDVPKDYNGYYPDEF